MHANQYKCSSRNFEGKVHIRTIGEIWSKLIRLGLGLGIKIYE